MEETMEETKGETKGEMLDKIPDSILNLLKLNPYLTLPELAKLQDLSLSGIEYHISKLKKSGRLKRNGST